jgi:hypothetical protein
MQTQIRIISQSRTSRQARTQEGSALLITLLVAIIIGTTLASYLTLAENQNLTTVRSQTWNSVVPVCEAGVEDALGLLNKYNGQFDQLMNWTNTYSFDNWTNLGGNVYYVRRYVGSNYYDAYITNTVVTSPIIACQGYTIWYYYVAALGAPSPIFAATGTTVTPTTTSTAGSTRNVLVKAKVDPLFNVAMAALQTIDFKGNNIATDSFDSGDPNYSASGLYPFSNVNKTKANGDVVTDDTIINSLSIGNANIKGSVKTGPNGTIAIGPNGTVGDRAWVEGGSTGIESGHSANDMNVAFPDVTLPSGSGLWTTAPSAGGININGTKYDYVFNTSGDYQMSGLGGSVYVGSNAVVRLRINGTVSISGQDQIYLENTSVLKIYMNSASFSLGGNGLINNNGNANTFYYFGLPVNTSASFGGNATFVGCVYCPEATFTLGGGGNNTLDFIGASVSQNVKMNGNFNFHYDENLRRNGMGRGYIASDWKES